MRQARQICWVALIAVLCSVNMACVGGTGTTVATTQLPPPPPTVTVTISPKEVTGGLTATVTVTFSPAVPVGGAMAVVSSENTQVATIPSPTLTIAAGATTAMFTVNTLTVTAQTMVKIDASVTLSGMTTSSTGSFTLTVDPVTIAQVASITLGPPASVPGGQSINGRVTLTQAPTTPTVVQLSSSTPAVATFVSSSVPIPAGQTSGTFTVTTTAVSSQTVVTITATLNNMVNTPLTVTPPVLSAVSVAPASVTGGQASIGTVTLTAAAPAGGASVTLMSNSANATVPGTVTVPAGGISTTFTVTTSPVSSQATATITASSGGSSKTTTLTINPPGVAMLSFPAGGVTFGMTMVSVVLNGPAPAGGISVTLSSNDPSASVPASVIVPAGATSAMFPVTAAAVSSATLVTVTASSSGATPVMQMLTVNPPLASPANVAFSGRTLIDCASAVPPPIIPACPQSPFMLRNITSSTVTITSIPATSTPSGEFSETNNCPAMLASGGSCTITATFQPTLAGSRNPSDTITVMASVGGNNFTVTINLSGTAQHWVGLTWTETDVTAVGFNVYRQTQSGACAAPSTSAYTKLNTSGLVPSTSYADTDPTLVASSTYCYSVTAVNGGGESAFSSVATAFIMPP